MLLFAAAFGRYFLKIIRVLLLKGVGIESITNDVIALAVFGIMIMAQPRVASVGGGLDIQATWQ